MNRIAAACIPWLVVCFALVGCDGGSPSPGSGQARTAAPTDELSVAVARAYGIERSANRVMLNVSLLQRGAGGRTSPVDGTVSASAYNLNGQLKNLQMRRITEGDSIYFIGEVGISGTEILVFDIEASPTGQPSQYSVQFKREFVDG